MRRKILELILDDIKLEPLYVGAKWLVESTSIWPGDQVWAISLQYLEPDADKPDGSEPVLQTSRRWLVEQGATRDDVLRTAYKCALCSVEHRLGESFRFLGMRVFSPHRPPTFDKEQYAKD